MAEREGTEAVNCEDEDVEEPVDCPMCGGKAGVLGVLGRRVHYWCLACGMQFSRAKAEEKHEHMDR